MTSLYDNIPDELAELAQWCVYKKEWVEERQKFTKIPYNPNTGMKAKSNDPTTWSEFDIAVEVSKKYDGIGFFFHNGYYGVDLDNCESEILRYQSGDWEDNMVAEFIETLTSYSEISPSGKGVHIICKGDLPEGGRRRGDIEMYNRGRFFTMTGNRISEYKGIYDDSNVGKINHLHYRYIGNTDIKIEELSAVQTDGNELDIEEIISDAINSKNGLRFKFFMQGGWEQFYSSQSEADMAFANDLAFWCARDFEKMDSIFRRSSLMRDKWDSKREQSTYGEQTLNKAIRECTNVYQPVNFDLKISEEALKGGKVKAKPKAFSYDDTGNTERFLYAFKDNVLYSYTNKIWYYYAKKYWAEDTTGKVFLMADYIANSIRKEPIYVSDTSDEKLVKKAQDALKSHIKYTRGFNGKSNMIKDVQHHVAVKPEEFDQHGLLFNTQNGYIDLANGHLMEHQKSKYFTRISFADYDADAKCPLWEKFLSETFQGNQELIDYLQRAIGYSLSADVSEQQMFILLGNGQNGKSVLLNVINEVFGSYAMNIQPQTIAVKNNNSGANQDIARLQGARFVTTTEPNRGMKLDEGVVKQITGGDTVTARFLYGKEFEYKPEFKLWMATNYKPIISGTDEGIWRRMAIIPFEYHVPKNKVDKKLTYKLKEELSGILNWCVEGYQQWRIRGLDEPEIVKAQRHDYRNEMDSIQRFVEECCDTGPDYETQASELWDSFNEWVKYNNEYDKFTSKRFYMELQKEFEKRKSNGVMVYKGIKLGKETKVVKNMFDNIIELR